MYSVAKKKDHDPIAVELGRRGGKARALNLTAKQRSEGARIAVMARWEKERKKKEKK